MKEAERLQAQAGERERTMASLSQKLEVSSVGKQGGKGPRG